MAFNEAVGNRAEQKGREGCQEQKGQPVGSREPFPFVKGIKAEKPFLVKEDHRQNRAKLYEDLKRGSLLPFKTQQVAYQNEMPGRGDRNKFRYSLHQTQNKT